MSFFGKQFMESHIQQPGPIHTDPSTPFEADNENDSSSSKSDSRDDSQSKYALDLRHNDTSFLVIAKLVVNMFSDVLDSGASSLELTHSDRRHLDRMVDDRLRPSLVDAVCHRLETCPEDSDVPIHVTVRKCQALGMNRRGSRAAQNILYATPGTIISINVSVVHKCIPYCRYSYIERGAPFTAISFHSQLEMKLTPRLTRSCLFITANATHDNWSQSH
jgi:hypothetical protein